MTKKPSAKKLSRKPSARAKKAKSSPVVGRVEIRNPPTSSSKVAAPATDSPVVPADEPPESVGVKLHGGPLSRGLGLARRMTEGGGPRPIVPVRSAAPSSAIREALNQAYSFGLPTSYGSPSSTSRRVLTFKKLSGGTIGVVKLVRAIPNTTLLNTYNELVRSFDDIRTVACQPKLISPQDLAKGFRHTSLGKVATLAHWEEWLQKFRSGELTARNAALVFLKDATRLEIKTLKSRLSRARNPETSAKQPRATESNL